MCSKCSKLRCCVSPQVGNGRSCQRRWQIAAMWWRIYPEELLTCSGWAASPRQERDLSVTLQHLLLWRLIPKARKTLSNMMVHVCSVAHAFFFFYLRPRFGLVFWFTATIHIIMEYTSVWSVRNTTVWRVTQFSPVFTLLHRHSHSSHPDWVTGVKGHCVRTTDNTEELQFPLWDQQVGFLIRNCNFRAKLSVTFVFFRSIYLFVCWYSAEW